MKNIAILITSLMWMMYILAPVRAEDVAAGRSAASFLKISPGAAQSGMGDAGTAFTHGVSSIYWNPASLVYMSNKNELLFMHNEWFQGVNYEYLSYGRSLDKNRAVGAAITYINEGKVQRTTVNDQRGAALGKFSNYGFVAGGSYSQIYRERLAFGVNLKYIHEKLENESAGAFAGDIGLHYITQQRGLSVGVNVQNIGTRMKFMSKRYYLPTTVRVGAAYISPVRKKTIISIAVDAVRPLDFKFYLNAGLEISMNNMLSLRVGYASNNELHSGITAGAGIKKDFWGFDYSYVPFGKLGDTHRFSVNVNFPDPSSLKQKTTP